MSGEYLLTMNYFKQYELLNSQPVVLARHFQHRVENFFKEILLIPLSTMGRVIYNATRIELQVRGFPQVIWILNPPVNPPTFSETLGKYIEFTDNTIHANLPAS